MSTEEHQSRFTKMIFRDHERHKRVIRNQSSLEMRDAELALKGALGILEVYPDEAGAYDLAVEVVRALRKEGISFAYLGNNWPAQE